MPTVRDRAFVEVAQRSGKISAENLRLAASTLEELEKFGISKFIAGVLTEKGIADEDTVAEIVREFHATSLRCPACDGSAPLSLCTHQGDLKCPSCKESITLPEGPIAEGDLFPTPTALRDRDASGGNASDSGGNRKPKGGMSAQQKRAQSSDRRGAAQGVARGSRHESQRTFLGGYGILSVSPPEVTRYQITKLLGISAAGRLYRIQDNGIFGVLKALDPAVCADRGSFRGWVELMQRLQDAPKSATVKPTQYVKESGVHYVVRPFVAPLDASLRVWLRQGHELTPREVVDIAVAVLNSLSSFHALKIVHGNLKPENVLWADGAAQLIDPGIHLLFQGLAPADRLVRSWEAARYTAPEVLQGLEATPAADVYSTGRVLEELLAYPGLSAEGPSGDLEAIERLRALTVTMTASDPSERQPSAKEVLRDLQKPAGPASPARVAQQDSRPISTPRLRARGGNRLLRPQFLGPALFLAVAAGLCLQGWFWARARAGLASPTRADDVADELLGEELSELRLASQTRQRDVATLRREWNALLQACKGTPWETRVQKAADGALSQVEAPRTHVIDAAVFRLEEKVAKRQWIAAGLVIAEASADAAASDDWNRLREEVREQLFRELGMVLIPGGDVNLQVGQREQTVAVAPFLIDARQVAYGAATPKGFSAPAGHDPKSPVVRVSLDDAKQLARLMEKRLPTLAEWIRLADVLRGDDACSAYVKEKIGDVGSRFEWVDGRDAADGLARAGYGFCLGAERVGIPLEHPVRRWMGHGYEDVTVRLVRDLQLETEPKPE